MRAVELQIGAIVHFDPLCRSRLRNWLKNLSTEKRELPGFIAIEWDRDIFEQVKEQRSVLRQMAEQEWPGAPQDFVNAVSEAIGFEADTHEEVFPHVETIWLDQGRDVPDSSVIADYARDRMAIYKSYWPKEISIPSTEALEAMSRTSWKSAAGSAYAETDRDSKFASHILEAITKNNPAWAIAIVGASHASDSPGCMRYLLETKGVLCEVAILEP
jgi:hypothetical protein